MTQTQVAGVIKAAKLIRDATRQPPIFEEWLVEIIDRETHAGEIMDFLNEIRTHSGSQTFREKADDLIEKMRQEPTAKPAQPPEPKSVLDKMKGIIDEMDSLSKEMEAFIAADTQTVNVK